jgi:malonyl-CoA/methylmalonyl-CoA synthetase
MFVLLERAKQYRTRTAIISSGTSYTYHQLVQDAQKLAYHIRTELKPTAETILFLVTSSYDYVVAQWAIWLCGKIAVPIHTEHPDAEIAYLISDTFSDLLLCHNATLEKVQNASYVNDIAYCNINSIPHEHTFIESDFIASSIPEAMLIYTSGTTGKPKGVVITHQQLAHQMESLTQAWDWSAADRIVNVLPMHHVHGVINIACCALYNGAIVEMYNKFQAAIVMDRLCSGAVTLFMAVPTIYHKLIQYYYSLDTEAQLYCTNKLSQLRLMVSGSAALPLKVLDQWHSVSGHILLERYGMTEIGMALSNPYVGYRKPGSVGTPLPLVQVQLIDEGGAVVEAHDIPGEILVKGITVFERYWNKPEATAAAFDKKGWFKTGDMALRDAQGYYTILGRNSSDIIKSGGYKISALEIENEILEYANVLECCVVALPDAEWGEVIAVALVAEHTIDMAALQQWLKQKLAPYKQPRHFMQVDQLPRNAMGKLLKKSVVKLWDM